MALAEEADILQQQDAAWLAAYDEAAAQYTAECRALHLADMPLRNAHTRLCQITERRLPRTVPRKANNADAQ